MLSFAGTLIKVAAVDFRFDEVQASAFAETLKDNGYMLLEGVRCGWHLQAIDDRRVKILQINRSLRHLP
jgi:hypothetical protein